MGKRGIEPPLFTTWELIYSQLQHRQSLPLPQNCICQLHDILGDIQAPASLYVDGELRRLRQGTTLLIQPPAAILLYRE